MRSNALIVVLCLLPVAAHAACKDAPKAGVDWNGCEKQRVMLGKADLRGAKITGADFEGSDLASANMAGADLSGASIERARMTGADLTGAKLVEVNAYRTNFSGAKLVGANLTKAEMIRAEGSLSSSHNRTGPLNVSAFA